MIFTSMFSINFSCLGIGRIIEKDELILLYLFSYCIPYSGWYHKSSIFSQKHLRCLLISLWTPRNAVSALKKCWNHLGKDHFFYTPQHCFNSQCQRMVLFTLIDLIVLTSIEKNEISNWFIDISTNILYTYKQIIKKLIITII